MVFSRAYPAWQHLFSDLLPAHLLKDAPGSWTGATLNGLPASGGPFRIVSVDRARGEVVLARNDLYIAYLTTYPSLSINHAVLLYGHAPAAPTDAASGIVRYRVYDPNHPEAPREMVCDRHQRRFSYQKDWDFVGGEVTVLQVYGLPLQ